MYIISSSKSSQKFCLECIIYRFYKKKNVNLIIPTLQDINFEMQISLDFDYILQHAYITHN